MADFGAWVFSVLAAIVPGLSGGAVQFNGYVEADRVYVSTLSTGLVAELSVREGARVTAGQVLFRLNQTQLEEAAAAARARVEAAAATLRNLETGGRAEELAVIRAQLSQAEANQTLAASSLERTKKLATQGVVSKASVDQAQANADAADAAVAQLKAQLAVSELPARNDQIVAAEASLAAAEADARRAMADLSDRTVTAAVDGTIERVFFDVGEVAAAGSPVLSLLPDGAKKVEFFLPEPQRGQFSIGQAFTVSCDGCGEGYGVVLDYIASEPEHTPPVIYSRDQRDRLVYLAEAHFTGAVALTAGQPVNLKLVEAK